MAQAHALKKWCQLADYEEGCMCLCVRNHLSVYSVLKISFFVSGAQWDARDKNDKTPFELAEAANCVSVRSMLFGHARSRLSV